VGAGSAPDTVGNRTAGDSIARFRRVTEVMFSSAAEQIAVF